MSTATTASPSGHRAAPPAAAPGRGVRRRRHLGRWIGLVIGVLALVLVVTGTKVVRDGDEAAAGSETFDKASWGAEQFPVVKKAVTDKAVDAPTLAAAIAANPDQALKDHGVEANGSAVYATTFTGTVTEQANGIATVAVDGMPAGFTMRLQTGPAINGTDLRDVTGRYSFGQFTNQIEYQDAGAALNDQVKKQVLDPVDAANLTGRTVTVTGAFTSINPQGWLVTPVSLEVR